ncbi:LAETG motif-containing sortase-dependent surface protein, partial [Streptomyces griseus]|uniref:LAETG motif-containing sortase-dependent surface protein n=1 Tax=Streptomyces griseus TaxID=1911 RepID=UPI003402EF04
VAQTQNKSSKPTIKELEAAAAAAQKAYEEAVKARDEAQATVRKTLEELSEDSHPLVAAANAAKAAAKDAADKAVAEAKKVIAELPADATEERKTAAATALSEAEATATAAATAKTAADTKAKDAGDAVTDARIEAFRAAGAADKALEDALAAKIAADAALAKAIKEAEEEEEGEDCVPGDDLTAVVTGLPNELVAGKTTDFTLRMTNDSDRQMEEVIAYVGVHATDRSGLKDTGKFFRLQWSSESSPTWKNVKDDYIDTIGALKAHTRTDLKMRLTLDKATPAGNGVAFVAADFYNEDGSCGGTPGADMYEFDVKAAGSKPGKTEDAKPKPATTTKPGSGHQPQGSTSGTPAKTGTDGSLAATGSSSATTSIALAGGAAVLLGAAAVFVVRRRKTGSDA